MDRISNKIAQDQFVSPVKQARPRSNGQGLHRNVKQDVTVKSAVVVSAAKARKDVPAKVLPTEAASPSVPAEIAHTAITLSPLDLPSEQFRSGLDRRKQNRQLLMDWLRTALVENVDFGRVHIASKDKCEHARAGRVKDCTNQWHWSKPSLFKPGAEKITGLMGMTVHFPSLNGIENAILSGHDVKQIMMRCELQDAQGRVVAEGVGARSIAQDYGDMNKACKMAEKSAHIDATLRLAGLSEVFTQDLEDRPVQEDDIPAASSEAMPTLPPRPPIPPVRSNGATQQAPRPAAPVATPAAKASSVPEIAIVGPGDVEAVKERIAMIGIAEKRVISWLYKVTKGTVTRFDQLNVVQCASLMKRLNTWAEEAASETKAAA